MNRNEMKEAMGALTDVITLSRQAYEHALRVGYSEEMAAKIAIEIVTTPLRGASQ